MPCKATQHGRVMVTNSNKTWSTGEGNGDPLQHSSIEDPMNSMKKQNDMTLKDELPNSVGAQYATGDQWRNNSRRNEEAESKIQCFEDQYCIGTWNFRSENRGKWEVVKQAMARVNIDILRISELKWTGMGEFNLMTIISTTVGKNPIEEME